jgi:bifunctional non-homologous end joining protein LigD
MPRTPTQRLIRYRDPQRRVWYVSEVARLKLVSASIDGPSHFLVIRFEREGEERFARWIGGHDWRERSALQQLFAEAEPVRSEALATAHMADAVEARSLASPAEPNDTATRHARPDERPSVETGTAATWDYDPQQALLVAEPPKGDRWVHEIKLDGFRMGLFVAGRGKTRHARIISRKGTDYTAEFPELVAAAMELPAGAALLDGEVVVLDERGRSSFQLLQQLGASRRGLAFFAFDLLALDGEDLKPLPLQERKRRLETLIGPRAAAIRYTPHFDTDGATVLAHACRLGAEGIVSKCRTAPYRAGRRSEDWQKTKCVRRQEFVVGGFTEPERSREGVGAILVGYYEGESLRFAGKVGTGRGWNDAFGRRLRELLEPLEVDAPPFEPVPPGALAKRAHWVEPRLVAEVQFAEWTGDGKIRHPSLQGFRPDKRPTDVRREFAE